MHECFFGFGMCIVMISSPEKNHFVRSICNCSPSIVWMFPSNMIGNSCAIWSRVIGGCLATELLVVSCEEGMALTLTCIVGGDKG